MTSRSLIAVGTLSGWLLFLLFFFFSSPKQFLFNRLPSVTIERQTVPEELVARIESVTETGNPIPGQDVLEMMTHEDLENLYHRYISSPQTTCSSVERMGRIKDGGWELCLDPRYAPDPNNCLVYSFGIDEDFSYDDAMAAYGCEVHSFDPSMTTYKDHLRGERVHFHLEGVGAKNERVTRKGAMWTIRTLSAIRKRLGHSIGKRRVDILKFDVEGAERQMVPVSLQDGSLSDIAQVCFEMHGLRYKKTLIQVLPH